MIANKEGFSVHEKIFIIKVEELFVNKNKRRSVALPVFTSSYRENLL